MSGSGPVTHLTPDHPAFAETAATVTPIHQVHKQAFPKKVSLYADQSSNSHRHLSRHENVSKFRG